MDANVMVVEDEYVIANDIKYSLEDMGYEVRSMVSSGEDAIERVSREKPDLILMDIQLPGLDGYEATRRIKSNPALQHIPVIAVTSYGLSGDDAKAFKAGCDAYVAKPFSPRALLAKIREYVP